MKISVIIPTFNKWHLTNQRLTELLQFCGNRIDEVVLIDDCSQEEFSHLNFWKELASWKLIYHRNKKNMGFGFSHNAGADRATGDILVFLSNDVKIQYDFTVELRGLVEQNPMSLIGHRLIDWKAGWNEFGDLVVPYLEGYFLACSREVWEILGGFDDIYLPYSVEDICLSMSAVQNDIMLLTLSSSMDHMVGQTASYSSDRMEITKRNRERFIQKWKGKL